MHTYTCTCTYTHIIYIYIYIYRSPSPTVTTATSITTFLPPSIFFLQFNPIFFLHRAVSLSTACYDWTFARLNVTKSDVNSQEYDPEWNMEDAADWLLFPAHLFNSISTVVSLIGLFVWLFSSPHNSDGARDLDRTCTKPIYITTYIYIYIHIYIYTDPTSKNHKSLKHALTSLV